MICPYCNKEAIWCENKEIYGKNYGKSYMCYYCKPCNAYVGCHENSKKPLGTMANKELRDWRIKAHFHIDPLWKSKKLARGQVYARLNKIFGREIHIGESDIETCQKILSINLLDEKYCKATHPVQINTDNTSRGRKYHITNDGKTTLCNMKVTEIVNSQEVQTCRADRWQCKVCFSGKEVKKDNSLF